MNEMNQKVNWAGSEPIFAEPIRKPLLIEGQETKWDTIHTMFGDKVQPLSVVSKKYELIPNQTLAEAIQETNLPFELKKISTRAKARTNLIYEIQDDEVVDSDGDSKIKFLLKVQNSYDGHTPLTCEVGFFRVFCSNMHLLRPVGESSMFKIRHHSGSFKDDIKDYLTTWISDGYVTEKNRILEEKEKMQAQKTWEIGSEFFLKFPADVAADMFTAIQLYSKIPVNVQNADNTDTSKFLMDLAKMRGMDWTDGNRVQNIIERSQVRMQGYNEDVQNAWQMYCMLVKIVQLNAKNNFYRMDHAVKVYQGGFSHLSNR